MKAKTTDKIATFVICFFALFIVALLVGLLGFILAAESVIFLLTF